MGTSIYLEKLTLRGVERERIDSKCLWELLTGCHFLFFMMIKVSSAYCKIGKSFEWTMWFCSNIMLLCSYEWNSFHVSKNCRTELVAMDHCEELFDQVVPNLIEISCYGSSWSGRSLPKKLKVPYEKKEKKLKFYKNPILSVVYSCFLSCTIVLVIWSH